MGYTTDFEGRFKIEPPLDPAQVNYLQQFSRTRWMKRDSSKVAFMEDPLRDALNLNIGAEGEHFVGIATGDYGQTHDESIIDYNNPPKTQPGLWCQWVPTDDGQHLEWDRGEKFYDYVEWLKYLIEHFFEPFGRVVSGSVEWDGEERGDVGLI